MNIQTAVQKAIPRVLPKYLSAVAMSRTPFGSPRNETDAVFQAMILTMECTVAELRRLGLLPTSDSSGETILLDGGVWEKGAAYPRGSVVTHSNSAWVCRKSGTLDEPPSDSWRLVSKGNQWRRKDIEYHIREILKEQRAATGSSR